MEETALRDLDSRLQKQVENARKAVDKNPAYAVDILLNIVNRNPGCLEARKILRQAEVKAAGEKTKGFNKFLSKITTLPFSLASDSKVKKDPEKAMETAEGILKSDPHNPVGHRTLGAAAEALGLYETAAFAYEGLCKTEPESTAAVKRLMNAYIEVGKPEEAIRIGEAAYRKDPSDDEVQDLIKRASVEQTMEKGRWEEDESFREKLADEDEAQKLEQASRAKTGESGLRALIEDALEAVEKEPESLNHYRDLASHYRKLGEFDNAIEWVEKARQTEAGKADVNLERLVGTIQSEKMAKAIKEKEAEVEASPDDASLQAELERLRAEERQFRLQEAEKLVQRYPNEFAYRYELGELYFEEGETDKAIKELQNALRSPKVRISALILLGKAYKMKGFWDMAAEQLGNAKAEIPGVNEQKKNVLYELGECFEKQGEMDKAMSEYKALYGADISYRDVAAKIDAFYAKKNEG